VGYAGSRFNELIGKGRQVYTLTCNAENFIESAKSQGLKISSTPIQGGIMVWQKGKTLGGGDGAGHVAVVEEVYSDGTILTSESGYNAWAFKTIRRSNSNGRWGQASAYKFRGCIINPAVTDAKVVPAPKLSVDGIGGANTVRAMQKFFGTPQDGVISGQVKALNIYYPSLKAVEYGKGGSTCVKNLQRWLGVTQDGVIGQGTVKAWQKELGVQADGIFGSESMKAWQRYLNEHEKAVYPIKEESWSDKAVKWAKSIANDNSWHYVKWTSNVKTHECPICYKHPKGSTHGWNCIGFAYSVLAHGAGIKIKHNNGVINNKKAEDILKAKTDKDATKIVREALGNNDFICFKRSKGVPQSLLKAGDICLYYKGSKYQHTFPYIGGGQMIDCTSVSNVNNQIKQRKALTPKVVIRYTGK
jgi:surface antigen/cell wall-associated NlpC family hydrolase